MLFKTKSGSLYEIDYVRKRVRRICDTKCFNISSRAAAGEVESRIIHHNCLGDIWKSYKTISLYGALPHIGLFFDCDGLGIGIATSEIVEFTCDDGTVKQFMPSSRNNTK